jgi:hypothetical protein
MTLGSKGMLSTTELKDWDPEICKTVDYWYEESKPKLSKKGNMEFYKLSCSDVVEFKLTYLDVQYTLKDKEAYLIVGDNIRLIGNYRWYLQYHGKPKPSTLRRDIYKWDPNRNCWSSGTKYTDANIDNYTGIREAFDDILLDTESLTSKSDILEKLGLSPSINYLMSSAPGMGKTSLIKCIATHLNVDIYVLDHKAVTTSDPSKIFGTIYTNANKINIYIFEDFDRYLRSSKSEQMASLLNALDGVEKMPPSLRFFTTNSRIRGEEFKAFYTRMRRIYHFDQHTNEAYKRSINIVLGDNSPQSEEIVALFKEHSISMREANQLLVSSMIHENPGAYIRNNIKLREEMREK